MLRRNLVNQSRAILSGSTPFASALAQRQSTWASSRIPRHARTRVVSRWYSASSEPQKNDSAETANVASEGDKATGTDSSSKAADPESSLQKEVEVKNREIVDLKDKYLRSVADFRNLQERTRREIQSSKDFAIQRFAKDLVESIDNFDLALSTVPAEKLTEENKDLQQLHGGLKMTETILMQTLKKHGLERFDPSVNGDKFDPNLHDATFQTPQPDKEDGTVFHTTQKGFMLNGRVLRAAKVGVVKNT